MKRTGRQALVWWVATVMWSLSIFLFTASPVSTSQNTAVALRRVAPPSRIQVINLYVRKSSHLFAFGLLGALSFQALRAWPGRRGAAPAAWVLTTVYAMSDEVHQAFVPGRAAAAADVGIDALAAAVVILLLFLWQKRRAVTSPQWSGTPGSSRGG